MSDTVFFGSRTLKQDHEPVTGRKVQVFIAAIEPGQKEAPIGQDANGVLQTQEFEVDVAEAAKGATSIPLVAALAAGITVNVGQYLTFADPDDIEFRARIRTKATEGATALEVDALDEAIPAGAKAEFPPYLWDRTNADLTQSYSFSATTTFNTGLSRDGTPESGTKDMNLPGLYYHYNAALATAQEAADNGNFIYAIRMQPVPNSNFQQGLTHMGRALVTQLNMPAGVSGNAEANLQVGFMGDPTKVEAVPT